MYSLPLFCDFLAAERIQRHIYTQLTVKYIPFQNLLNPCNDASYHPDREFYETENR